MLCVLLVLLPTVGCTGVKEAYDLAAAASDCVKQNIVSTIVSVENNKSNIKKNKTKKKKKTSPTVDTHL